MNNSSATPSGNNILDAAHLAAGRGWRVIPLHRVGGGRFCSCEQGGRCKSAGKHPKHKTWQNTPPMSAADIQATWDVQLVPNLGIATGDPSGFWVLDIDPSSGGIESAQRLAAQHGPLPATRVVKTGSGGYHYHFAMPDFPVTNRNAWFRQNGYPGIDVRGTGGQIVAPPSVSDKGEYVVVHDVETIPQAPAWLLEAIRPAADAKPVVTAQDVDLDLAALYANDRPEFDRLANYARTIRDRELARLAECREKGWDGPPWNITTFEVACTLIQLGNSPWTTYAVEHAYADVFAGAPRDAGFGDAEVNKCFSSAQTRIGDRARDIPPKPDDGPTYKGDPLTDPTASTAGEDAGSKTPAAVPPHIKQRPWDDLGNGQRMVDHYGQTLRWIEQAGTWAVYTGGRWTLDEMRLGQHLVQKMIDGLPDTEALLYSEELEGDDDKASPREKFLKWAKAQRSAAKVAACLKTTQGILGMQARITDFDQHDMLLNVANGVVDLTTGELREPDPALMLMQQSPVVYDPEAKAPMWQRFLDQVLPDRDIQRYLQQICGYSLSGKTGEQGMFLHHGNGANGKSVFLVVAGHVAGDYGQVVPRETLLTTQSGSEHPTSVARMVGKRFLQVSETAAGRRLDEEVIKQLTGGEKATARYMGRDFFDFTPTGKIHYVTNHLPRLTNADSIWRRLHLIGWRVTIPEEQRDPELAQKIIAAEAAGVLAWMVQGAVQWAAASRLVRPEATILDLKDYRDDQDEFGDFMRECLQRVYDKDNQPNDAVRSPLGVIYGAYTAWCWRTGIRSPMRQADLGRALRERGVPEYRTSAARGFKGLRVVVSTNLVPDHPESIVVPDSPAGLSDPLAGA